MTTIQSLISELEQEAQTTAKMLDRVPEEKFSWQPHQKSMTVQRLASHLAELPGWVSMTLRTGGLDLADPSNRTKQAADKAELIRFFNESVADAKAELSKASEDQLNENWTLRVGDQVLSTSSKAEVLRMSYCQTVHHRAQLGVYLRLLDIPIPGSYGPSADEHGFG